MFKYVCEKCDFLLYGATNLTNLELEQGTILQNMESVFQQAQFIVKQKIYDKKFV